MVIVKKMMESVKLLEKGVLVTERNVTATEDH